VDVQNLNVIGGKIPDLGTLTGGDWGAKSMENAGGRGGGDEEV